MMAAAHGFAGAFVLIGVALLVSSYFYDRRCGHAEWYGIFIPVAFGFAALTIGLAMEGLVWIVWALAYVWSLFQ